MNGRPTTYTLELAALICEGLAEGKSLKAVCSAEGMPVPSSVYLWLHKSAEGIEPYIGFSDMYTRAKEEAADVMVDDMLDIADNDSLDIDFTEDGKPFVRGENIQRSRLRVDTRKWIAMKLKPRKYGDKVTNAYEDKEGKPADPPTVELNFEQQVLRRLPEEVLNDILKSLEQEGKEEPDKP